MLIALVIGGLVLVAGAVILAVRGNGGDTSGTPKIAVDQQVIDFGDVKLNSMVNFSVKVTNEGDGVLKFKDKPYIEVAEGC